MKFVKTKIIKQYHAHFTKSTAAHTTLKQAVFSKNLYNLQQSFKPQNCSAIGRTSGLAVRCYNTCSPGQCVTHDTWLTKIEKHM